MGLTVTIEGKLHLEPTVVGLSKFNESVMKLKKGHVAGYVHEHQTRKSVCDH